MPEPLPDSPITVEEACPRGRHPADVPREVWGTAGGSGGRLGAAGTGGCAIPPGRVRAGGDDDPTAALRASEAQSLSKALRRAIREAFLREGDIVVGD